MAIVPRMLRPGLLIRRKALRDGIFGQSRLWKVIAVFVFGRSTLKRLLGKNEQILEKATLKGGGHEIRIRTITPVSKRQQRKAAAGGVTRT